MNPAPAILSDFVPVTQAGLRQWSRPQSLTFLDALAVAPLGDTEILHLAHYAPVAILLSDYGPEVALILHSELCTSQLVGSDGRWRPPYAPMAIRCLPFRNSLLESEPEFAPSLCDPSGEQHRFTEADGTPTKAFGYVMEMLQRLARGRIRLGNAARALIAADVLVPLHPIESRPDHSLLVVNAERLAELSGVRAGALTSDANLPYELAAASIFSQRWLAKDAIQDIPTVKEAIRPPSTLVERDRELTDRFDDPLLMDDSSLFSIEDFLKAVSTDP
jgi:hypothetical protein